MNNHFVKEKSAVISITIACILMLPTLCLPLWGLYEMFFIPHYWKNRWRLYRLLRKGKVNVKRSQDFEIFGDRIIRYQLIIEDSEYSASIWSQSANPSGQESMTLTKELFSNEDYIGLFVGSTIMSWINRKTIKMIRDAEIK